MSDPVSWLLIEPGWKVVTADGDEVGKVVAVDGDLQKDIFSGLEVKPGLLGPRKYLPAEHVRAIYEGRIVLDVPADQLDDLAGE
jgi:hypothetical protein